MFRALCSSTLLAIALFSQQSGQAASLIGETVRFQCPECGPPFDQMFLVTNGGPELTPFDQWQVDVEASSLRITWTISGLLTNPGHMILSDLAPFTVTSATLDPSSTWTPNGISFTSDSVTLDFGGQTVSNGIFALINFSSDAAQTPEPSTFALMIGGLLIPVAARFRKRNA